MTCELTISDKLINLFGTNPNVSEDEFKQLLKNEVINAENIEAWVNEVSLFTQAYINFIASDTSHFLFHYLEIDELRELFDPSFGNEPPSQDTLSKLDRIDDTQLTAASDIYLYKTYGATSTAMLDMHLRFTALMKKCIFFLVSDTTAVKEVLNLELLNKNIKHYLQNVWEEVINNLSLFSKNVDPEKFKNAKNPDGTVVDIFSSEGQQFLREVTEFFSKTTPNFINSIFRLSQNSNNAKEKYYINAFQNYFILTHFDDLINSYYNGIVSYSSLRKGLENPMSGTFKYQLVDFNKNMYTSWGRDEDVNNVTEEVSDFVKLFFNSCQLLDRHNEDAPVRNLNIREVTYVWGVIKRLQYTDSGKTSLNIDLLNQWKTERIITNDEFDLLTKEDPAAKNSKILSENSKIGVSLSELISASYSLNNEIIPLIFKVLVLSDLNWTFDETTYSLLDKEYALTLNEKAIIYSVYKQCFLLGCDLRTAWEQRESYSINEQPRGYFAYITHFFNTQSHVPNTLYNLDDSTFEFKIKSLGKASLDRHSLYYRDTINGKFSPWIDKYYNSKEFSEHRKILRSCTLNYEPLTSRKPDDKHIEIKVGENFTLEMYYDLRVRLFDNLGNEISLKDINLTSSEYSPLCDFVLDILNLNYDDFKNSVLPSILQQVSSARLISAAAEALYTYSVSCLVIGENKSLASALNQAKNYFDENTKAYVKLQKNSQEIHSFLSNTQTSTIIPLCKTLDVLNGVLREASAKGADGNTINTMGTSQLLDKTDSMIFRGQQMYKDKYICDSLKSFSLLYRGPEIARDIKATGGRNKKAVELTPAETGAFGFMNDFAQAYFSDDPNDFMRVLPCIISDKPKVLKVLFDLNVLVTLPSGEYKSIRDLTQSELEYFTTEELGGYYEKALTALDSNWQLINSMASNEKLARTEDYGSDEENTEVDWFVLLGKLRPILFGIENNFKGINYIIDERTKLLREIYYDADGFLKIDSTSENKKYLEEYALQLAKDKGLLYEEALGLIVQDLNAVRGELLDITNSLTPLTSAQFLEALNAKETSFKYYEGLNEFINQRIKDRVELGVKNYLNLLEVSILKTSNPVSIASTYFYIFKGGRFYANPALCYELYKYGKKNEWWLNERLPKSLQATYRVAGEQFFKQKNAQWVADFIQDGGEITLHSSYGKLIEGVPTLLARFQGGGNNLTGPWYKRGRVVLGKIEYKSYSLQEVQNPSTTEEDSEEDPDSKIEFKDERKELVLKDNIINVTDITSLLRSYMLKYAFQHALLLYSHVLSEDPIDPTVVNAYGYVSEDTLNLLKDKKGNYSKEVRDFLANASDNEAFLQKSNLWNYTNLNQWLNSPDFSFEVLTWLINTYLNDTLKERQSSSFNDFIHTIKVANIDDVFANYNEKGRDSIKRGLDNHHLSAKQYTLGKDASVSAATFTVHPLIEKYNTLSMFLGLEYMLTTVGSHVQHPGKDMKNLQAFVSQAFGQQTKRNVILSGTKHLFLLNELDGLPAQVKMATLNNTKDVVYTLEGKEDEVLDDDGAVYGCGITNYLENRSLRGSAVGVDKKLIFWSQNAKTGTNRFIKCATFYVTNKRISTSRYYMYVNYHSLKGDPKELEPYYILGGLDITTDFGGHTLDFGRIHYKRAKVSDSRDTAIAYMRVENEAGEDVTESYYDNSIVSITNVNFDPTSGYTNFTAIQITDADGNVLEKAIPVKYKVKLKNVHDIWLFFGGAYSMNLSAEQVLGKAPINPKDFNEDSFIKSTFVVNNVGYKLGEGPLNLNTVVQYLKNSLIHYFPTHEALKCGSANQNNKTQLYNTENSLAYTVENLYDAGPQLNAEHESDDSVLSMMTLVLNALGARGFTAEQANQVYKALRSLTRVSLKGFIDSMNYEKVSDIDKAKESLEKFLTTVIRKTIDTGKATNDQQTLADLLLQQTLITLSEKQGSLTYQDLKNTLPIDNLLLLRSLMSKISSTLVKSCIKLKFPGTMDVLSPSNGIYKLYNGHLRSYYVGLNINDIPNKIVEDLADIKIGVTYKVPGCPGGDVFKVNEPKDYYFLRRYAETHPDIQIEEILSEGRDLSGYNVKFKIGGKTYNIWDLDVVRDAYHGVLDDDFREVLQNNLMALSNYNKTDIVLKTGEIIPYTVKINGEEHIVDRSTIEIEPYEIIMSKLYQTLFGLKTGDDVLDIVDDKLFFFKRLLENTKTISQSNFDVELKTIDGKNKYYIEGDVPAGFHKLNFRPVHDETGNIWFINDLGECLEQLGSDEDEIYTDGNILLIKTKNISFYLDNVQHTDINISSRVSDELAGELITQFEKSSSEHALWWVEKYNGSVDIEEDNDPELSSLGEFFRAMERENEKVKNFKNFLLNKEKYYKIILKKINKILSNTTKDNEAKINELNELSKKNKWIKSLLYTGLDLHTSFIKSLDILAARIPAQCMQSFMSMKIVGFEESGLNTAYVSRFLIYLQGSDFKL